MSVLYAWAIKYGLIAVLGLAILGSTYLAGRHDGNSAKQKEWDLDTAQEAIASEKALTDQILVNEAVRKENDINLKTARELYEKAMRNKSSTRSTGLQIPRSACSEGVTVPDQTPPTGGITNPPVGGGIRLPEKIEQDLRRLADDANNCTIRLRELQDWERRNEG